MIEWKEFDKNNPPDQRKPHLAVGDTGIIRYGHYSDSFGGWIDNMGDPIRFVTHFAPINLPLKEPKP